MFFFCQFLTIEPDDELFYDSESLSGTSTSIPSSISTGQSMSTNASVSGHGNAVHPGTKPDAMVVQPETVLEEVGESLSSMETASGVDQSTTPTLPPESPLVSQGICADPPSVCMAPIQTMSTKDDVSAAKEHSPLPPNIASKPNTDNLEVLVVLTFSSLCGYSMYSTQAVKEVVVYQAGRSCLQYVVRTTLKCTVSPNRVTHVKQHTVFVHIESIEE